MGLPMREALAFPMLWRTMEVLSIVRLTKEIPVAGVLHSGLGVVLLSAVSRMVFILMFLALVCKGKLPSMSQLQLHTLQGLKQQTSGTKAFEQS